MATVIFSSVASASGTVGLEVWLDLGLIPVGKRYWIGSGSYTSVSKVLTFELRTNTAGKSVGALSATSLLDTSAVKAGATVTKDLYKRGTLHVTTAYGSGVEHWWLRVFSKSSTSGNYLYKISYMTE